MGGKLFPEIIVLLGERGKDSWVGRSGQRPTADGGEGQRRPGGRGPQTLLV